MELSQEAVLASIKEVLSHARGITTSSTASDFSDIDDDKLGEVVTNLAQAVERFAPPDSQYRKQMDSLFPGEYRKGRFWLVTGPLIGIVKALKLAYEKNYLQTVQQLVHASVFSDLLEMADHLLETGYKDPAAVLAGGVLEGHLRKLCDQASIPTREPLKGNAPRSSNAMNDDLGKAGAYPKMQQDAVKGWLKLRNSAAHGQYQDYDEAYVRMFIAWLRDFVGRFPA